MARISTILGRQRVTRRTGASEAEGVRRVRAEMQEVIERFLAFYELTNAASVDALSAALEAVLDRSHEYVPVDTGALKMSGFVETREGPKGATGTVGYGKGMEPHYTLIVHEDLTKYHEPPTSAKFLQRAFEEITGDLEEVFADSLRKGLEKAMGQRF